MNRVVSAIGFLLFAAVSLAHFLGFYRILVLLWPGPGAFAAPSLVVTWLGALGMLVQGLRRNRLWTPFCVVFVYVMLVILAGTRILIGVPSTVADGNWRDPDRLLTPDAKYILHNHGNVTKVVSREEFLLYSLYGTCYFTAGGMLLCAALCLGPVDHDNQLGFNKRRR